MYYNAEKSIASSLIHEGGFVNHPDDPGGATNRGVTIGTLKSIGMDLDGDGDVDIADLRHLTEEDAIKVYKTFYWDKVNADLLPTGVDHCMSDYAINSGPSRAGLDLQRSINQLLDDVELTLDKTIGPKTIEAAMRCDSKELVTMICKRRIAFMKVIKNKTTGKRLWITFGKGWQKRVDGVLNLSLLFIRNDKVSQKIKTQPKTTYSFLEYIFNLFGANK